MMRPNLPLYQLWHSLYNTLLDESNKDIQKPHTQQENSYKPMALVVKPKYV